MAKRRAQDPNAAPAADSASNGADVARWEGEGGAISPPEPAPAAIEPYSGPLVGAPPEPVSAAAIAQAKADVDAAALRAERDGPLSGPAPHNITPEAQAQANADVAAAIERGPRSEPPVDPPASAQTEADLAHARARNAAASPDVRG